jgi:hypothetical protein
MNSKSIMLSLRLPIALAPRIDNAAARAGLTRSAWARRVLEAEVQCSEQAAATAARHARLEAA